VPNGTVDCATVTLLALFFSQPEKGKVEIRPLFARLSCCFQKCGIFIALEHRADNQFLIFYGKSIRH
jgi:hypothetical protein